ncbi:hypothetical protein [Aquimarina agarivorans]|uniref:hypothetical protein n=1 Tax=Aquimarina agarivorans TaxID=980584 RepID=UPI000248E5FA|nr:hypothetical protein [Aquimarina agarivorans]
MFFKNIIYIFLLSFGALLSAQNSHKVTFDFDACDKGNYSKCYKNLPINLFSDLDGAKMQKEAFDLKVKQLIQEYISHHIGKELLKIYTNSNSKKLGITFWVNSSGQIEKRLFSSTIKKHRATYKKLKFLCSKLDFDKKVNPLFKDYLNEQYTLISEINQDTTATKDQILQMPPNKPAFDVSKTLPIYSGCHKLGSGYTPEEKYIAERKCIEYNISQLIQKKINHPVIWSVEKKLSSNYNMYESKITTYLMFSFDKKGKPSNPKALGILPELENEALRLFTMIPKAILPGTLDGKPVGFSFNLPITYVTAKKDVTQQLPEFKN